MTNKIRTPKYKVGDKVKMHMDTEDTFHILEVIVIICVGGTQISYLVRAITRHETMRIPALVNPFRVREMEIEAQIGSTIEGA